MLPYRSLSWIILGLMAWGLGAKGKESRIQGRSSFSLRFERPKASLPLDSNVEETAKVRQHPSSMRETAKLLEPILFYQEHQSCIGAKLSEEGMDTGQGKNNTFHAATSPVPFYLVIEPLGNLSPTPNSTDRGQHDCTHLVPLNS